MWNFQIFILGILLLISYLVSSILIVLLQPRWLFKLIPKIAPGVKYFAETNEKIVAITIDDGPDSITTPTILETLATHQTHATFFLISERLKDNENLVKNMIKNGHEIGNHMVKDEQSIQLSIEEFEQQFLEADQTLNQLLDHSSSRIHWFRPGGGWYNAKMIKIVEKYNYQAVLGSIFPYDTHIPFSQFAAYQILLNLRPGAIIVIHDSARDGQSGEWGKRTNMTLNTILPEIKRRGYRTVTLSEMFLNN
ncbi:polysaccharide deacetylase family protein [Crocosphaera sp. XPORK-15E]|uniref:polysaccharide deacetylase family protein n=1 Tax=Crocosphaera sp. XPORK-15E TaxID=3110247 RepID=UPI002B1EF2D5|nr:polysaccharide deacetylase family protein [Crocosphaera sp. XPORK-15E]MEA5533929.1 polysaccharide deacetylase family protein [Crocosphaera sp. XPORK-15E]